MDLKLTHTQGGMAIFERTGIYTDVLVFSSASLKRKWRRKGEKKQGSLKIDGRVVFNFIIEEYMCNVQEVVDGVPSSIWTPIEFAIIMRD